ncbi:hypothetical protein DIPPA_01858 [Diplonema papillatum]|nr:hypothetical protein DIPPA_01858 [Diplonema papillatum]
MAFAAILDHPGEYCSHDLITDPELRAKKLRMARFGNRHLGAVEVSSQMAFAAIPASIAPTTSLGCPSGPG